MAVNEREENNLLKKEIDRSHFHDALVTTTSIILIRSTKFNDDE